MMKMKKTTTTKTTKTTNRVSASKLNAFTPPSADYVSAEDICEVWKVKVHETHEIYLAASKAQALEYIGKKGATSFNLTLTKVNINLIYN